MVLRTTGIIRVLDRLASEYPMGLIYAFGSVPVGPVYRLLPETEHPMIYKTFDTTGQLVCEGDTPSIPTYVNSLLESYWDKDDDAPDTQGFIVTNFQNRIMAVVTTINVLAPNAGIVEVYIPGEKPQKKMVVYYCNPQGEYETTGISDYFD